MPCKNRIHKQLSSRRGRGSSDIVQQPAILPRFVFGMPGCVVFVGWSDVHFQRNLSWKSIYIRV
jgi:hypothetical protein